jgi:hypothetical protein
MVNKGELAGAGQTGTVSIERLERLAFAGKGCHDRKEQRSWRSFGGEKVS